MTRFKKSVYVFFVLTMMFTMMNSAVYADENPIKIIINENEVHFENQPIKDNGYILAPIKEVFNAFEFEEENVFWNKETRNLTAYKNGNKVQINIDNNGTKEFHGKLVNGKVYVPVEYIAKALGEKVEIIEAKTNEEKSKYQTIVVNNEEEFIENIGPNRKLVLKGKSFNLSQIKNRTTKNPYVKWEEVYDGFQLVVTGVDNLTIEGGNSQYTDIVIEPRHAHVLSFINSNNIKIRNTNMGHTPEKGECSGGVLFFKDSKHIEIEESRLFGCGTIGIMALNVDGLIFEHSIITECSSGIMYIRDSKNLKFTNSKFVDNENYYYGFITIDNTSNVAFDKCVISNNVTVGNDDNVENELFHIRNSKNISLKNATFKKNYIDSFSNSYDSLELKNITLENNQFGNDVNTLKSIADLEEVLRKFSDKRTLNMHIETERNHITFDGIQDFGKRKIHAVGIINLYDDIEKSITEIDEYDQNGNRRFHLNLLQDGHKSTYKISQNGQSVFETFNLVNDEDRERITPFANLAYPYYVTYTVEKAFGGMATIHNSNIKVEKIDKHTRYIVTLKRNTDKSTYEHKEIYTVDANGEILSIEVVGDIKNTSEETSHIKESKIYIKATFDEDITEGEVLNKIEDFYMQNGMKR